MSRLSFAFHGVVGFELDTEDAKTLEFFRAEYGSHQGAVTGPRIHLHFKRQDPLLGVPGGFTRHTHKIAARWAYRVTVAEDQIDIDAIGNTASIPMIHHMMVHPSLRWLAARQGVLLLHAGAIARGGQSLLFTGMGGAGKTTTTSLALAYGRPAWSLHADDYVFIGDGPQSYAYLTRSHLYRDLLRWLPELASRLTGAERRRLEFWGRVRAWSGDRIKWPVRLAAERLWPGRELILQASPGGLALLERGDVAQPVLAPLLPGDSVVEDLLQMNFYEARHYIALLTKCGTFDAARIAQWQAMERDLIQRAVTQIPLFTLTLPVRRLGAAELGVGLAAALDELAEVHGN